MTLRRGQWVTLASPITVIAAVVDGQAIKKTLRAGTLGIHHPPDQELVSQGGRPAMDRAYQVTSDLLAQIGKTAADLDAAHGATIKASVVDAKGRGLVAFHQVEPVRGFETLRAVLVDPVVLAPVTDRDAIPAARLATMDPAWTPIA